MSATKIVWAWGTNTHIAFNPAADILDFGWFAAGQFTVSEVNGTVVIAIPSNHQTYTLDNTTLSELHLSNIVGKDPTAIGEWTTALGSATTTPPPVTPPVVTPPVTPTGRHAAPCHTADHRRDQLVVERRLHGRHDRDRKRRDLQG